MAAREGLVGGLSWGGGSPTPVALETAGSWRELLPSPCSAFFSFFSVAPGTPPRLSSPQK